MNQPEERSITLNGFALHYLDWRNDHKPSIVLLHGLFSNARYWDFLAERLSDEFHVISLDQRGHGNSDWTGNYGQRDYVTDLEIFIQKLSIHSCSIIGHSLGGISAILYAAIHPDNVNKLVIVDIGPELAPEGVRRIGYEMESEPSSFSSLEGVYRYLMGMNELCDEHFLRYQISYAVRQNKDGRYLFKYDPLLKKTSFNSPRWVWDYLKDMLCPVLLLRGEKSDLLSKETAHLMKDIIPTCILEEIEEAGHGIPGDNPEAFYQQVSQFLGK